MTAPRQPLTFDTYRHGHNRRKWGPRPFLRSHWPPLLAVTLPASRDMGSIGDASGKMSACARWSWCGLTCPTEHGNVRVSVTGRVARGIQSAPSDTGLADSAKVRRTGASIGDRGLLRLRP
jgi:hypothetical protein